MWMVQNFKKHLRLYHFNLKVHVHVCATTFLKVHVHDHERVHVQGLVMDTGVGLVRVHVP